MSPTETKRVPAAEKLFLKNAARIKEALSTMNSDQLHRLAEYLYSERARTTRDLHESISRVLHAGVTPKRVD